LFRTDSDANYAFSRQNRRTTLIFGGTARALLANAQNHHFFSDFSPINGYKMARNQIAHSLVTTDVRFDLCYGSFATCRRVNFVSSARRAVRRE